MTKLSKDPSNLHLTDKFCNTYRYLDDIFTLNNQKFSLYIYTAEIYSKELTLNKSNHNVNGNKRGAIGGPWTCFKQHLDFGKNSLRQVQKCW